MNRRFFIEIIGAALGANALPLNAAVEIESIWAVRN